MSRPQRQRSGNLRARYQAKVEDAWEHSNDEELLKLASSPAADRRVSHERLPRRRLSRSRSNHRRTSDHFQGPELNGRESDHISGPAADRRVSDHSSRHESRSGNRTAISQPWPSKLRQSASKQTQDTIQHSRTPATHIRSPLRRVLTSLLIIACSLPVVYLILPLSHTLCTILEFLRLHHSLM